METITEIFQSYQNFVFYNVKDKIRLSKTNKKTIIESIMKMTNQFDYKIWDGVRKEQLIYYTLLLQYMLKRFGKLDIKFNINIPMEEKNVEIKKTNELINQEQLVPIFYDEYESYIKKENWHTKPLCSANFIKLKECHTEDYSVFKDSNANQYLIKFNCSRCLWNVLHQVEVDPMLYTVSFEILRKISMINEKKSETKSNYSIEPFLQYYEPIFPELSFKLYIKKQESSNIPSLKHQVVHFHHPLFPYQEMAVNWMMDLESRMHNIYMFADSSHSSMCLDASTYSLSKKIHYSIQNNKLMISKVPFDNTKFKLKFGILASEMGLGKTLMILKLIANDYELDSVRIPYYKNGILHVPTNLIVVPSHLVSQWSKEISKHCPNIVHTIIETKVHTNLLLQNNINLCFFDIIITTEKQMHAFYGTVKFKRVVYDEFHEYWYTHNGINKNNHRIYSEFEWFVSGSPFNEFEQVITLFNKKYNFNNIDKGRYIELLKSCYFRITKQSVEKSNQLVLPHVIYHNQVLQMLEVEEIEYKHEMQKIGSEQEYTIRLQMLCCDLYISLKNIAVAGNSSMTISEIRDNVLCSHTYNLEKEREKLEDLNSLLKRMEEKDESKVEIGRVKSMYTKCERKIANINWTIEQYKQLISENRTCIICCEENIKKAIMLDCKHYFCYDCHVEWFIVKKAKVCPMCRTASVNKVQISFDENKQEEKKDSQLDNYINKYGTKIGHLLFNLKNRNKKSIVFSQWDDFLHRIQTILCQNNIRCTFVRDNIYVKNKIISSFTDETILPDDDRYYQVLLLSTKTTASGLNLTIAKDIHIMDVINDTPEKIKVIEGQAIARSHRIGQMDEVHVFRYIMKNTIEEELYNKTYITEL